MKKTFYLISIFLLLIPIVFAGSSTRHFSKTNVNTNEEITISYTGTESTWSLKEKLPSGWSWISSVSLSPDGYLRDFITSNPKNYIVKAPSTSGAYTFDLGEYCVGDGCSWIKFSTQIVTVGCNPNCSGKQCGDNGCGGSCGTCSSGQSCSNNQCISVCMDNDHDSYNQSQTGCGIADCNDNNANVHPLATESCNGIDSDCDSVPDGDEGFQNMVCYSGPSGSDGVGICKAGIQSCTDSGWGSCIGEIKPANEVYDGKDNDCDGFIDEGFAYDLSDFPAPFFIGNQSNSYIITGDNAPAEYVVRASDIAISLTNANPLTNGSINITPVGNILKLASEVSNVKAINAIIIGGPCGNDAAARVMNYPQDCTQGFLPGFGLLQLFENNGFYQLIVDGYFLDDFNNAIHVIKNYKNYNLYGSSLYVYKVNDNIAVSSTPNSCMDNDHDGYNLSQSGCGIADCNDNNVNIHPNAQEILDDINQNCRNDPPSLSGVDDVIITVGDLLRISPIATDVDGDDITITFFPPLNSRGEYTPDISDVGVFLTSITASDGISNFTQFYYITVKDPNVTCQEIWDKQPWGCQPNDTEVKIYIDRNHCGTTNNRPIDHGILISCNYCDSTWSLTKGDCINGTRQVSYAYTNDCCQQTGLISDCDKPQDTTESCQLVNNNLVIDKIKVKYGSKSKTVNDGDTITKAKPGDDISFEITVKNSFLDNMDINNIEGDIIIEDIDDGDNLDDDASDFDLEADKDEKVKFNFKIPSIVDEKSYNVRIKFKGTDDNGSIQQAEANLDLKIEKDKHKIIFNSASITPEIVNCNKDIRINWKVVNVGSNDEDNSKLALSSQGLDLQYSHNFELKEGDGSDAEYDASYSYTIPSRITPGIYTISANVYYDDKQSDSKNLELQVEKCESQTSDIKVLKPEQTPEIIQVHIWGQKPEDVIPITKKEQFCFLWWCWEW